MQLLQSSVSAVVLGFLAASGSVLMTSFASCGRPTDWRTHSATVSNAGTTTASTCSCVIASFTEFYQILAHLRVLPLLYE